MVLCRTFNLKNRRRTPNKEQIFSQKQNFRTKSDILCSSFFLTLRNTKMCSLSKNKKISIAGIRTWYPGIIRFLNHMTLPLHHEGGWRSACILYTIYHALLNICIHVNNIIYCVTHRTILLGDNDYCHCCERHYRPLGNMVLLTYRSIKARDSTMVR